MDIDELAARLGTTPSKELPEAVRAKVEELKARPSPRIGIEIKHLASNQVYEYHSDEVKIRCPIPSVDVFSAFLSEYARVKYIKGEMDKGLTDLEMISAYEAYGLALARAWYVLHWTSKRDILMRPKWTERKVDEHKAKTCLLRDWPQDLVFQHLPAFLDGLYDHIIKKKAVNPPSTLA